MGYTTVTHDPRKRLRDFRAGPQRVNLIIVKKSRFPYF